MSTIDIWTIYPITSARPISWVQLIRGAEIWIKPVYVILVDQGGGDGTVWGRPDL